MTLKLAPLALDQHLGLGGFEIPILEWLSELARGTEPFDGLDQPIPGEKERAGKRLRRASPHGLRPPVTTSGSANRSAVGNQIHLARQDAKPPRFRSAC